MLFFRRGRMRLFSPKLDLVRGGGEDLLRVLLMVVVTDGFRRFAESRRPSHGLLGGSAGMGLRLMRNLPWIGGVDERCGFALVEGVLRWVYGGVDSERSAPGKAESSSVPNDGPLRWMVRKKQVEGCTEGGYSKTYNGICGTLTGGEASNAGETVCGV